MLAFSYVESDVWLVVVEECLRGCECELPRADADGATSRGAADVPFPHRSELRGELRAAHDVREALHNTRVAERMRGSIASDVVKVIEKLLNELVFHQ